MEGRYEVVGLGLENRTELKGKKFNTVEEPSFTFSFKAISLASELVLNGFDV